METKKNCIKSMVGTFILTFSFLGANPVFAQPNILRAGGDLTGFYPNPTIRAGAVTSLKIQDGAVTGSKIGAGAVTSDKLSPTGVVPGTYTNATVTVGTDGRISSASSGSGNTFETLDVTGAATFGENVEVTGSVTVNKTTALGGATAVESDTTGVDGNTVDVDLSAVDTVYVRLKCNDADGCFITGLPVGNVGQILVLECDGTAFSPFGSNCGLFPGVVYPADSRALHILNGGWIMTDRDTLTLMTVTRSPFHGGGVGWIELSRVDYPNVVNP